MSYLFTNDLIIILLSVIKNGVSKQLVSFLISNLKKVNYLLISSVIFEKKMTNICRLQQLIWKDVLLFFVIHPRAHPGCNYWKMWWLFFCRIERKLLIMPLVQTPKNINLQKITENHMWEAGTSCFKEQLTAHSCLLLFCWCFGFYTVGQT